MPPKFFPHTYDLDIGQFFNTWICLFWSQATSSPTAHWTQNQTCSPSARLWAKMVTVSPLGISNRYRTASSRTSPLKSCAFTWWRRGNQKTTKREKRSCFLKGATWAFDLFPSGPAYVEASVRAPQVTKPLVPYWGPPSTQPGLWAPPRPPAPHTAHHPLGMCHSTKD